MMMLDSHNEKLTSGEFIAKAFWKAKNDISCNIVQNAPILAV
jgi:hypothetical protein